MKGIVRSQMGFTLLEVMVAFALIVVILFTTYITQGSSLTGATRNKHLLEATNLARNLINELEIKFDNAALEKIDKITVGTFDPPNSKYSWKVEVSEIDFAALKDLFLKKETESGKTEAGAYDDVIARVFQEYMNKSVRKMIVTVSWPVGEKSDSVSFTEFLVNYDNEVSVGL